jgi:hypothetical protein
VFSTTIAGILYGTIFKRGQFNLSNGLLPIIVNFDRPLLFLPIYRLTKFTAK